MENLGPESAIFCVYSSLVESVNNGIRDQLRIGQAHHVLSECLHVPRYLGHSKIRGTVTGEHVI